MTRLKPYFLIALSLFAILLFGWRNNDLTIGQFELPSSIIHKIIIDTQGVKWIATEKGIVSFDGTKWINYTDGNSLNNGRVSDIVLEISSGVKNLWVGLNNGLSSMLTNSTPISAVNYNTKNSGILGDTVSAVGIDLLSTKYIGTTKGLSILKAGKWDQFLGRRGEEILSRYKISAVSASGNGYIYAATQGGGVSRFKYTDAVSGATTFNKPWAWGLPSDTVYTVFLDGDAQWFGTLRGAAYHSTEYTKSDWITYTRADGLICDSVYSITKDLSGNIWFGTHKGATKLSSDSIWTSYTIKDGLVDNKVNTISADIDGSIWFGTDNGISHFANGKWVNYQQGFTSANSPKISDIDLFSVYPNPAKDQITIERTNDQSENMSLEIRSISGVLKKSGQFKNQHQSIEIGDLPPGLYLLKVSSDKGSQTTRIIKQ